MNPRGKVALLLLFFAACATAALLTTYLEKSSVWETRPAELYSVVNGQLAELQQPNFPGAYQYASSTIQQRFTLDQFSQMVRDDYPALLQVSRAEYGVVQTRGTHASVQVYLIGRDGQVMPCVYILVREAGLWRIEAARLLPVWPSTVKLAGTLL